MDTVNTPTRTFSERLRDMDLRKALILYTLTALVIALLLSTLVTNLCGYFRWELRVKYESNATRYSVPEGGSVLMSYDSDSAYYIITDQEHNVVNEITVNFEEGEPYYNYDTPIDNYISNYIVLFEELARVNRHTQPTADVTEIVIVPAYSDRDSTIDFLLSIVSMGATPALFAASVILSTILFYRYRFRTPIQLLEDASRKIAENDLAFTIHYARNDEMGKLCYAFETMRRELAENNRYTWQQIEERKQLNAAFSHDLRTPLTVLKGHTSMILSSIDDNNVTKKEISEEVTTMSKHIARMENYVNAMTRLQRLEDFELHCEAVSLDKLQKQLYDTAQILVTEKRLRFIPDLPPNAILTLDDEIIMQVYENLLTNAVRYARTKITVTLKSSQTAFSITVSDDGSGFTAKDLAMATRPFYRAGVNDDVHLGLGLHICRVLCERHNGNMILTNGKQGGGEITATFGII